MKFLVNLDRDETGMTIAERPAIPGCVSQGPTELEALDYISEAIPSCHVGYNRLGWWFSARSIFLMTALATTRTCSTIRAVGSDDRVLGCGSPGTARTFLLTSPLLPLGRTVGLFRVDPESKIGSNGP